MNGEEQSYCILAYTQYQWLNICSFGHENLRVSNLNYVFLLNGLSIFESSGDIEMSYSRQSYVFVNLIMPVVTFTLSQQHYKNAIIDKIPDRPVQFTVDSDGFCYFIVVFKKRADVPVYIWSRCGMVLNHFNSIYPDSAARFP